MDSCRIHTRAPARGLKAANTARPAACWLPAPAQADLVVAGVPRYNNAPATPFKACIDHIVRVGRTFGLNLSCGGGPYWPLLAERHPVAACGPTAFACLGVGNVDGVAIKYDELTDPQRVGSNSPADAAANPLVQALSHGAWSGRVNSNR